MANQVEESKESFRENAIKEFRYLKDKKDKESLKKLGAELKEYLQNFAKW